MGRKLHYRPGSFYRVDDRTGFPQRAERTRKQWNDLIVDERVWEPRQPQDLVKGVKDDQTVPEARPLAPAVYVGPIYEQSTAAAAVGAAFIPLSSTFGMIVGDAVGVFLESGVLFNTVIEDVTSDGILIGSPLPDSTLSGGLVVDYRIPFTGSALIAGAILTEDLNYLTTEDGSPLIQEAA